MEPQGEVKMKANVTILGQNIKKVLKQLFCGLVGLSLAGAFVACGNGGGEAEQGGPRPAAGSGRSKPVECLHQEFKKSEEKEVILRAAFASLKCGVSDKDVDQFLTELD